MGTRIDVARRRRDSRWRAARWITAALLLVLPLLAMRVPDEVDWDLADFAIFGAMLAVACGAYEFAVGATGNSAYRAAVAIALVTAFLLVWINLAVGIIGNEANPANLMYGAVLLVGVVGAVVVRFRPHGMARALVATALAQALVAVICLMVGLDAPLALTGIFVALWLTSAWLFRRAAVSTG